MGQEYSFIGWKKEDIKMENEIIYTSDSIEWTKGQCKKCKGIKYWNEDYRSDNYLCDDCLSPNGMYYDLTDEQAQKIEHEITWIVSNRIRDIKHEFEYKFHAVQFVLQPFFLNILNLKYLVKKKPIQNMNLLKSLKIWKLSALFQ